MKKEWALDEITKGVTNPWYFKDIRPFHYSVDAYCGAYRKEPKDSTLEREWVSVTVPRLKESNIAVLRETGERLEKEWRSQKRPRSKERFEETQNNKMRKLLSEAKYAHRAATLEYSGRTLPRNFEVFGTCVCLFACRCAVRHAWLCALW